MVVGIKHALDAGNAAPCLRFLKYDPGALRKRTEVNGVGESVGWHAQERMVIDTTTQGFDSLRSMIDPTGYLRLVLDPVRLAILGAAAVGPVDAQELAARLGAKPKTVLLAIVRLREAGLLDEEHRLALGTLRRLGSELPAPEGADPSVTEGPWGEEEATVMRRFFDGTRLTQIPAQRSKRLTILERLAQEFEPGVRYAERDVNFTLQLWHPDYAALRRYLVDEGFLTRADGVYWRTGGRFAHDPVDRVGSDDQ